MSPDGTEAGGRNEKVQCRFGGGLNGSNSLRGHPSKSPCHGQGIQSGQPVGSCPRAVTQLHRGAAWVQAPPGHVPYCPPQGAVSTPPILLREVLLYGSPMAGGHSHSPQCTNLDKLYSHSSHGDSPCVNKYWNKSGIFCYVFLGICRKITGQSWSLRVIKVVRSGVERVKL